jgi:hypothetical protein
MHAIKRIERTDELLGRMHFARYADRIAVRRDILRQKHGRHPGHPTRGCCIDALNARMRMRAAHEYRVQRAR